MEKILELKSGHTALRRFDYVDNTPVFYLPGHKNTFQDHKGILIEDICKRNHIPLSHWIYYGWSDSYSKSVPTDGEGYIREWLSQSLEVFDHVAKTPQVLVGYSMGGFLSLAIAMLRPQKVKGIIGLASGFGDGLCRQAIEHYGSFDVLDNSGQGFFLNLNHEGIFEIGSQLNISCPVRLYHCIEDSEVSWKNNLEICKALTSTDVSLTLSKASEKPHRLNDIQDIDWLEKTLIDMTIKPA